MPQECWWDHLLLDTFGANALGIFLGMQFISYFELEEYHWLDAPTVYIICTRFVCLHCNFLRLLLQQKRSSKVKFSSWFPYDWAVFKSARRWLCVVFIVHLLNAVQILVSHRNSVAGLHMSLCDICCARSFS